MKTRCPGCRTLYRIDEDAIIEAGGMARCFRCYSVFNAFENAQFDGAGEGAPTPYGLHATEQASEPLPDDASQAAAPDSDTLDSELFDSDIFDSEDIDTSRDDHSLDPDIYKQPADLDSELEDFSADDLESPDELPPLFATDKAPPAVSQDPDLPFDLPSDLEELEADAEAALDPGDLFAEAPRTPAWQGLLAAVLVVGLAMQWAWFERGRLLAPGGRLHLACDWIPCPRAVQHDAAAYRVVEQPLVAPADDVDNALQFHARFANTAPFAQPLPDVQISLTDNNGKLLARRRLHPDEYLFPRPPADHLVDKGEVVTIDLLFEDPGRHATGFEISFL